ncbi:hypothetical protein GCM10023193_18910 [Planotetraspora kaengkrachanensis]|uniref:Uncharacterized protein n=2 Tax=Planotetraspora kaengkrachanensis TaxID=575193 RepID=A0A8J3LVS7_9ACTN|nr:hypothetical protein Pka01_27590 [Planotetraspora kaengkrachanensis]
MRMVESSPLTNLAPGSVNPSEELQQVGFAPKGKHSTRRRWLTGLWSWLPAAAVTAFTLVMLSFSGVSSSDMAAFSVYTILGILLPGMLIIRAVFGQAHTLAEEISLGLVLGFAIEVLTYIGARAIGAPLLVLVWPIATYAAFLTVPRLRSRWKPTARPKAPTWWSWALALTIAYLVVWSVSYFKTNAITWPAMAASNIDVPYHLSLIGELKNHMPPTVPMVAGEPLFYHWFLYTHFAATSWVTGVEPLVLLVRLGLLPMFAALVVLLCAIARRVIHSWPAALIAVMGAVLLAAPNLYLGTRTSVFEMTPVQSWESPTETFGALLFAPVVLLLIDLLQRRRHTLGVWLLLGVFLVVAMGAKATHLPILAAGLGTVAAVEVVRQRKLRWPTIVALGMTASCFLYAQIVLFGHSRQGLTLAPFSVARGEWGKLTALFTTVEPSLAAVVGVALMYVANWSVMWLGILGLLSRPRSLMQPAVLLMLGMGAAGIGAMLVLSHPHNAQGYFLQAAGPYLAILAVYGLTLLVRRARLPLRTVILSVGIGMVATYLIRMLCGVRVPLKPGQSDSVLVLPYIALLVIAVVPVIVMYVTGRAGLRAWTVIILFLTSAGLPAAWFTRVVSTVEKDTPTSPVNFHGLAHPVVAQAVPQGILTAGRWLRAHSEPNQLVATNSHCLWGYESPCDSREAWVAALTERRVLVEGWMYTPTNNDRWRLGGQRVDGLPFWDAERLSLNDAAFYRPSWSTMRQLQERYGVHWLFVDERRINPDSHIGDVAKLRFRSGDYAIYEIGTPT